MYEKIWRYQNEETTCYQEELLLLWTESTFKSLNWPNPFVTLTSNENHLTKYSTFWKTDSSIVDNIYIQNLNWSTPFVPLINKETHLAKYLILWTNQAFIKTGNLTLNSKQFINFWHFEEIFFGCNQGIPLQWKSITLLRFYIKLIIPAKLWSKVTFTSKPKIFYSTLFQTGWEGLWTRTFWIIPFN